MTFAEKYRRLQTLLRILGELATTLAQDEQPPPTPARAPRPTPPATEPSRPREEEREFLPHARLIGRFTGNPIDWLPR